MLGARAVRHLPPSIPSAEKTSSKEAIIAHLMIAGSTRLIPFLVSTLRKQPLVSIFTQCILFTDLKRASTLRNPLIATADPPPFNCGLHHRASFDEDNLVVSSQHHPNVCHSNGCCAELIVVATAFDTSPLRYVDVVYFCRGALSRLLLNDICAASLTG